MAGEATWGGLARQAGKKVASRALLSTAGPIGTAAGVALLLYDGYNFISMMSESRKGDGLTDADPKDCEGECNDEEWTADDEELVPWVSPDRLEHIIDRHKAGPGHPDASKFLPGWTEEEIQGAIEEAMGSGDEVGPADRPGSHIRIGESRGVEIEGVVDNDTGQIITGWPVSGDGVTPGRP